MMLAEKVLKKDRRAIAKLISKIEDEDSTTFQELSKLYPYTGKAHVVGVTGIPGAGKSTLVFKLAKRILDDGKSVGIVAVDPTSPFTGGAILGDRIRMQELATNKKVFIRSMGTRGNLGGLARATKDAVKVLDAFGFDYVLVETVGAGQSEVDIVKFSNTVVLVLTPGFGDDIQAIKAGILEIGDIFVVNKADLESSDAAVRELQTMLELGEKKEWNPPILKTVALKEEGINELFEEIKNHLLYLKKSNLLEEKRLQRAKDELLEILRRQIESHILNSVPKEEFEKIIHKISKKKIDPYTASEILMEKFVEG